MNKEKIPGIIKELLNTDLNLDFLFKLEKEDLETLTACIRNRLEKKREEEARHL